LWCCSPLFTEPVCRNKVSSMLRSMSRWQRPEPTLDEAEPSSRRGRRPNPLVDAAIRTATLELISEVGYDHVTFEAVATRAGVSRNAFTGGGARGLLWSTTW
jgi:Bacterial regulatory proteins, tetR family